MSIKVCRDFSWHGKAWVTRSQAEVLTLLCFACTIADLRYDRQLSLV